MASKTAEKADKSSKKARGAEKALLHEFFNDYYKNRNQVYRMNLVRGIFFGFGSVLGGTLVIAIIIWLFSLFVDIPFIGEFLKKTTETLEQAQ